MVGCRTQTQRLEVSEANFLGGMVLAKTLKVEEDAEDPKQKKEESGLVVQTHTEDLGSWSRNDLGPHVADTEGACEPPFPNSGSALWDNGWSRECKLK